MSHLMGDDNEGRLVAGLDEVAHQAMTFDQCLPLVVSRSSLLKRPAVVVVHHRHYGLGTGRSILAAAIYWQ